MCISIAVASKDQVQDAGAEMIPVLPNTNSAIISRESICRLGAEVNYRGLVKHGTNAKGAEVQKLV